MNDFPRMPKRQDIPPDVLQRLRADGRLLCTFAKNISGSFPENTLLDKFYGLWRTYSPLWALAALYYLAQDLLAASRATNEFSLTLEAWTERLALEEPEAGAVLNYAFVDEAFSSFCHACETGSVPWIGAYIPQMPEGDAYELLKAQHFRKLLEEYIRCYNKINSRTDLLTNCWENMRGDLRHVCYVAEYCAAFGLLGPGHVLEDKYVLETVAGIGGMGIVYRAWHKHFRYGVALKMMRPDCPDRSKFVREGRKAVRLTDPRFVIVKDAALTSETLHPFFTMDYVEGGKSLTDLIDHEDGIVPEHRATLCNFLKLKGPPDHSQLRLHRIARSIGRILGKRGRTAGVPFVGDRLLAAIVAHVAEAMAYLHAEGFVHCDLKPGNILIDRHKGPLVCDLGLSRKLNKGQTGAEPFSGTPTYTSPEQAAAVALTPQTDVYQLGAILYRGITGRAPFKKQTADETDQETIRRVQEERLSLPSDLTGDTHPRLEAICLKALHKNPSKRYQSAAEMAADLNRFVNGRPVKAQGGYCFRRAFHSFWCRSLFACLLVATGMWRLHWLVTEQVEGCVASKNWYRTRGVVPPPEVEFVEHKEDWPSPDVRHLKILRSSVYFDLTNWRALPVNAAPATAGRVEPAYYTRVIDLVRRADPAPLSHSVCFQFRTEGYEVDLRCTTHPFRVRGSKRRGYLGGKIKPVLVREIEVDLSNVPADGETTARIVIQGTIWNGFQGATQWAAFLAPDDLSRAELAVLFPPHLMPSEIAKLACFKRGARKEEEQFSKTTQNFHNPAGKSWWIWQPRDIRPDHFYYMEWVWKAK